MVRQAAAQGLCEVVHSSGICSMVNTGNQAGAQASAPKSWVPLSSCILGSELGLLGYWWIQVVDLGAEL